MESMQALTDSIDCVHLAIQNLFGFNLIEAHLILNYLRNDPGINSSQ